MERTLEIDELIGKDGNVESLVRKTNKTMRSNKCNQCHYTSSQAGHLRIHLKTHSGEKPNKCNQCDFASYHAGNLRTHLKTHSEKVKQMQAMQLCIFSYRHVEDSFGNAQRRKVEQMQRV